MKKALLVLAGVVLAVSWGASAVSDFQSSRCDPESSGVGDPEFSSYLTAWENFYPTSTMSDRMTAQTGSRCNVCHHPPNRGTQGTCYLDDMTDLLNGGMTIEEAIAALDTMDSDGDGVSNGVEITTQRLDDPNQVGYHPGLVGDMGTDPCGEDPNEVVTGVLETPPPASETICPAEADDFAVSGVIGGAVSGDALDLCASDDVYLQQANALPVSVIFPFAQIDCWANTTFPAANVTSIDYSLEWALTALVPGGQNPTAMRTFIRHYPGGPPYVGVDTRAGEGFTDLVITHTQAADVAEYIQASDGEIQMRTQAFSPGNALNANWVLRIDELSITVNQ